MRAYLLIVFLFVSVVGVLYSFDFFTTGRATDVLQGSSVVRSDFVYSGIVLAEASVDGLVFVHSDRLSSNVLRTDASSFVVSSNNYGPYGDNNNVDGDFDYSGKLKTKTSSVNLGAREYNPQIRRFIVPDPLLQDAESTYMYSANNPLKYIDRYGNDEQEAGVLHDVLNNYGPKVMWAATAAVAIYQPINDFNRFHDFGQEISQFPSQSEQWHAASNNLIMHVADAIGVEGTANKLSYAIGFSMLNEYHEQQSGYSKWGDKFSMIDILANSVGQALGAGGFHITNMFLERSPTDGMRDSPVYSHRTFGNNAPAVSIISGSRGSIGFSLFAGWKPGSNYQNSVDYSANPTFIQPSFGYSGSEALSVFAAARAASISMSNPATNFVFGLGLSIPFD